MQINVGTVPGQVAEAEVLVDLDGNPIAFGSNNTTPTYTYQAFDIAPHALATDLVQLIGSATKTIKITRIQISADASSVGEIDFYIYKRSALNTGGTSTHPTPLKYDSTNSNSTATLNVYSANPSALGAGILFYGTQYIIPGTGGNTWLANVPVIVDYGTRNTQPIILRNANESIAISLNGQTIPSGMGMYVNIEWTEE